MSGVERLVTRECFVLISEAPPPVLDRGLSRRIQPADDAGDDAAVVEQFDTDSLTLTLTFERSVFKPLATVTVLSDSMPLIACRLVHHPNYGHTYLYRIKLFKRLKYTILIKIYVVLDNLLSI